MDHLPKIKYLTNLIKANVSVNIYMDNMSLRMDIYIYYLYVSNNFNYLYL